MDWNPHWGTSTPEQRVCRTDEDTERLRRVAVPLGFMVTGGRENPEKQHPGAQALSFFCGHSSCLSSCFRTSRRRGLLRPPGAPISSSYPLMASFHKMCDLWVLFSLHVIYLNFLLFNCSRWFSVCLSVSLSLSVPISFNFSHCVTAKREEGHSDTLTSSLNAGAGLLPLMTVARKKKESEVLQEGARELLSHFNHQNLGALLKVTRNTLEAVRKRIHSSHTTSFRGNDPTPFAPWLAKPGCWLCVCVPVKFK